MELGKLQIGRYYRIRHSKAGDFVAEFRGLEIGDEADPVLVSVRIPTWEGSGQEWYAQGIFVRDAQGRKVPPLFKDRRLRPQFIITVEEYHGRLAAEKE